MVNKDFLTIIGVVLPLVSVVIGIIALPNFPEAQKYFALTSLFIVLLFFYCETSFVKRKK